MQTWYFINIFIRKDEIFLNFNNNNKKKYT